MEKLAWYRSKVIIGALVSIATKVLVATGVVSEITDTDQTQLVDLVLLFIGGIGDLVAIQARVTQKRAPRIAGSTSPNLLVALLALGLVFGSAPMLTACATPGGAIASTRGQTVDEKVLLTAEQTYKAVNLTVIEAVNSGYLKPGSPQAISVADKLKEAKRYLDLGRTAYDTGDAIDLRLQVANATKLITEVQRIIAR